MDGLFAKVTNPYCNTILSLSTSLLLCFESTPSQDYDGCFNDGGNEHFYLKPYENNTWIGIKGINPSLDGTVISIFCIIPEGPDNCSKIFPVETSIFNYRLVMNGNGIQQKSFV